VVDFSQPADIYVINTCAVTAKAAAQSRQFIRQALRVNPRARFVVTGCYAQVAAEKIHALVGETGIIVGNNKKHLLVEAVLAGFEAKRYRAAEIMSEDIREDSRISPLAVRRFANRTRALLKVQDGCNNFCSYCIVPLSRGRSRSQAPAEIFAQARMFAREGYREVVVTGIHVGDYGRDLQPVRNFLDLLRGLVQLTPELRYRISSLEPTEITEELLLYMSGAPNLMPHLHIPLQSGDNGILRKMNRRYTAEDFQRIIEMIRTFMPDAAIGVDVLVGFPGEDEQAFDKTMQLLTSLPVSYLHVFPYSKRPGTGAAAMTGQVEKKIKEERVARLRKLDNKKRIAFYRSQLGKTCRVLAEKAQGKGGRRLKGFTENYIPVHFDGPATLANCLVAVMLEGVEEGKVVGRSLKSEE
jgi:threonylcarbamoyladenosine tRNA methylthiotransferase MtaB